MPQVRLIRSTSFRLAAIYLLLFTLSVLLLGLFVYASVRKEIARDFDARIVEESESLQGDFAKHGLAWLQDAIAARGGGGGLTYGLKDAHGQPLAGDLTDRAYSDEDVRAGWIEMREDEGEERAEGPPEIVRALVTRLADGSILVVGDEQRRSTGVMRAIFWAFAWALAATLGLGALGGLYLSSLFLRRIDAMSQAARGIMEGDWRRRIPESKANDELSAVARTFNRMFDRLEKLLEANKHVSADIAHDLRKPLAHTLRRLEAARGEDATPESAKAAIETGITDIQGVLETFNALLRIGQIEAGARRAAFKPVDLAEIAREVADAFRPAAEEEGKTLVARLEAPLPMSGDRELLTQMIANLVDNALRHTPTGVSIEVASERGSDAARLIVADNGPGVAAEERERIFERFYRIDAARATPGSGLGLSLVAAIAELHGLTCKASDNGPGLCVTINFG